MHKRKKNNNMHNMCTVYTQRSTHTDSHTYKRTTILIHTCKQAFLIKTPSIIMRKLHVLLFCMSIKRSCFMYGKIVALNCNTVMGVSCDLCQPNSHMMQYVWFPTKHLHGNHGSLTPPCLPHTPFFTTFFTPSLAILQWYTYANLVLDY